MRISDIFGQGGRRDFGDCAPNCNNEFRGRGNADRFTGLDESRNGNYRYYDEKTDLLGDLFG